MEFNGFKQKIHLNNELRCTINLELNSALSVFLKCLHCDSPDDGEAKKAGHGERDRGKAQAKGFTSLSSFKDKVRGHVGGSCCWRESSVMKGSGSAACLFKAWIPGYGRVANCSAVCVCVSVFCSLLGEIAGPLWSPNIYLGDT